jgi:hypothetical protein
MDETTVCAGDDGAAPIAVSVTSEVTPMAASVVAGAAVTIAVCTGVGPRVAVITVSMIVSPIAVSVFAKGMDKTADCAGDDEVAPKAVSVMSKVTPIAASVVAGAAVTIAICTGVGPRVAVITVSMIVSPIAVSVFAKGMDKTADCAEVTKSCISDV